MQVGLRAPSELKAPLSYPPIPPRAPGFPNREQCPAARHAVCLAARARMGKACS